MNPASEFKNDDPMATKHRSWADHTTLFFFVAIGLLLLSPVFVEATAWNKALFNTSNSLVPSTTGGAYADAYDSNTGTWWQGNTLSSPYKTWNLIRLSNQSYFNIKDILITWYDDSYDADQSYFYGSNDANPSFNSGTWFNIGNATASGGSTTVNTTNNLGYKWYLHNMTADSVFKNPAIKEYYFYGNLTIGEGEAPPENGSLSPPSWVAPTPNDFSVNTTAVTLNASSVVPGVRYFLWFDTNANPTTLVVNNATTGAYTTPTPTTTDTYYYKAAVWNSTSNFSANTSVRRWISLTTPSEPTITSPTANNYTRFINITYSASTPTGDESGITKYNITLRNNDSSWNATIYGNNSLNTSYYWNTYGMNLSVNTPYRIRVTAYENNSLTVYDESEAFYLTTNGLLNITARTKANATINNLTTFTLSNTTAGFSVTQNASQNGSALIDIIKGYSYFVTVNATGYAIQNTTTANLSANSTLQYVYLYREQTIDIRFYDETTNLLLNTTNITFELISSTSSYNYTVRNGTLFADLLTPDSYTMRYGADNYSIRFYSLSIGEQSFNALNLTLCPLSICSPVVLQVKDQFDNNLEGAIIKVLKYDVLTNGYVLQETLTTNFEGQVESSLQVNNEYYKFIIEYDGAVVLSTLPTYIYGTTVTFVVTIGTSGFEEYFNATAITGFISKVSDIVYSFTWNDQDNTIGSGCLYAYTIDRYGKTLYNSSCLSTSSGTTFVTIDNATAENYELDGVVTKGLTEYTIDTLMVSFDEKIPSTGETGLFIMFLVMIAMSLIGLWNPTVGVILAGIIPFIFILIGFVSLSMTTGIAVMVLSFIVAYILNK